MEATDELKEKLQRRLTLNNEQPRSPRAAAPSPPAPGPLDHGWHERISAMNSERDKALEERKRAEDDGHHRAVGLASEVTRLRMDVEVMRKELLVSQKEVHDLRIRAERDKSREQRNMENAVHQDLELAKAEARVQLLSTDVAYRAAERGELQDEVGRLEEEVASHVVSRVRLEAQLRKSEVREAEMRRLLETAKKGRRPSAGWTVSTFSMHEDDEEEEEEAQGRAEEDGGGALQDMDDLEYAYEVAQLAGSMSLERALQLARTGSLWQGATSAKEKSAGSDGGEGEAAGVAAEDEYEAPLRELELALARIRSGATGSAGGAGDPVAVAAAGTGEAVDDLELFDQNLGRLQAVLGRLGARREPEASAEPASDAPAAEAQKPPRAEAPPPPPPPSEPEEPAAATPARAAPATPAPATPAPAGQAREGEEATSVESPMVPIIGLNSIFSPYARLGSKYRNILA